MKNEISVVKTNNKLIAALLQIKTSLAKLEKAQVGTFKTNGQFKYYPNGNDPIKLENINQIDVLISIDSFVRDKFEQYTKSAEQTFGLKTYPVFKWLGFTYDEWKHDLQSRASVINYTTTKAELEAQKAKFEGLLSRQDRIQMALAEAGLLDEEVDTDSEEEGEE